MVLQLGLFSLYLFLGSFSPMSEGLSRLNKPNIALFIFVGFEGIYYGIKARSGSLFWRRRITMQSTQTSNDDGEVSSAHGNDI